MELFTKPRNTANISASLPHEVIGFDSSEIYGTQPQPKRFFYVHRSASLCGIERGSLRACRLRIAGLSTLFSLTPMFDSIRRGLKNLHIRASTMNTISPVQLGQTHPKTNLEARFEVFQHGRLIASNLNGYAALGLKRMFPNTLTVKFVEMTKVGV